MKIVLRVCSVFCFLVLYFKSAEIRNSEINVSKKIKACRPKWLHTLKSLAGYI